MFRFDLLKFSPYVRVIIKLWMFDLADVGPRVRVSNLYFKNVLNMVSQYMDPDKKPLIKLSQYIARRKPYLTLHVRFRFQII